MGDLALGMASKSEIADYVAREIMQWCEILAKDTCDGEHLDPYKRHFCWAEWRHINDILGERDQLEWKFWTKCLDDETMCQTAFWHPCSSEVSQADLVLEKMEERYDAYISIFRRKGRYRVNISKKGDDNFHVCIPFEDPTNVNMAKMEACVNYHDMMSKTSNL